MPRTRDEILAAASASKEDHIKITAEEAKVLAAGHVEHRRQTSGRVPQRDFVMRKFTSGFRICGKLVIVEG